ncbi:MAG: hypothetical protein ABI818_20540, partial [Acidobacteriota bacterium]
MNNAARTLAVAGIVFAAALPAAAQQTNIEHVRALIAQATGQPGAAQAPAPAPAAAQGSPTTSAPFVTAGPRVDLSIQDAVARGLEKNIDIAVARITPRLTDFTLAGLEANYRVNLTAATSNNRNTRLPSQTTQGISVPTTSTTTSWSSGIAQSLWKGGGNYAVNWTNSRLNSPSLVNTRNPQLNSGLQASYVQPLWRGFKIDATRAALRTNRLSQQNDDITLASTTTTTEANIRNAYWDLV